MTIDKSSVDIFKEGFAQFFSVIEQPFSNIGFVIVLVMVAVLILFGLIMILVASMRSGRWHH